MRLSSGEDWSCALFTRNNTTKNGLEKKRSGYGAYKPGRTQQLGRREGKIRVRDSGDTDVPVRAIDPFNVIKGDRCTPCEGPVVDFLVRGGDCVDMGKREGKLWRKKGRDCCGRGRRERKIERKKRSRVRIEVYTRMANSRFQRGLRHTKTRRDGRRQRG
jgi:hypothetical protein